MGQVLERHQGNKKKVWNMRVTVKQIVIETLRKVSKDLKKGNCKNGESEKESRSSKQEQC